MGPMAMSLDQVRLPAWELHVYLRGAGPFNTRGLPGNLHRQGALERLGLYDLRARVFYARL